MDTQSKATDTVDFNQVPLAVAIKKYKDHIPPPHPGLILDVSRHPDNLGVWTIYTYKDNTHSFSDYRRQSLWEWMVGLLAWLNSIAANGAVQTEELEAKP